MSTRHQPFPKRLLFADCTSQLIEKKTHGHGSRDHGSHTARAHCQQVGAKLFNMLPLEMKKMEDPNIFKTKTKEWIWENIPSY